MTQICETVGFGPKHIKTDANSFIEHMCILFIEMISLYLLIVKVCQT